MFQIQNVVVPLGFLGLCGAMSFLHYQSTKQAWVNYDIFPHQRELEMTEEELKGLGYSYGALRKARVNKQRFEEWKAAQPQGTFDTDMRDD